MPLPSAALPLASQHILYGSSPVGSRGEALKTNVMAVIKIIGSGSSGNGYVIECKDESLVLELGMPYEDYVKNTDFGKISACLVSHKHGDHFREKVAKKLDKMGIPVFGCKDVHDSCTGRNNPVKVIQKGKVNFLGGFVVQAIPLLHSVENFGWLIKHPEFGRMVFATDTSSFKYRLKNINHWLIECNYDPDIVIDTKLSGETVRSNYGDHLSKQQCFEVLKENYGAFTESITLIHLSDGNSNAAEFESELKTLLGYDRVYVAGLTKEVQTIQI